MPARLSAPKAEMREHTCAMSSFVTGVSERYRKSAANRASGGRPRSSTTSMISSRFGSLTSDCRIGSGKISRSWESYQLGETDCALTANDDPLFQGSLREIFPYLVPGPAGCHKIGPSNFLVHPYIPRNC